jgi:transcriptional regulator with XRE-family HTH domain
MSYLGHMTAASPPAVPEWTLADRLLKARKDAHLTQRQLASMLQVGIRSIIRYESGAQVPRADRLMAWAMACHVDYEWLAGGGPTRRGGRLRDRRVIALVPLLAIALNALPPL